MGKRIVNAASDARGCWVSELDPDEAPVMAASDAGCDAMGRGHPAVRSSSCANVTCSTTVMLDDLYAKLALHAAGRSATRTHT